jgi:hypothetical protein
LTLTAEQLEIRRQGVGSSDIPAIVKCHPDQSDADVWLSKVDDEYESAPNDQTDIGNMFERPIAEKAMAKIPIRSVAELPRGSTHTLLLEPGRTLAKGIAIATPDFLLRHAVSTMTGAPRQTGPTEIMEAKNVGHRVMHRWDPDVDDDRGPPQYVIVQVQWQLEVWDLEVAYVAALLGGRDHRVFHVERDRQVGAWLRHEADRWWRAYVETRTPPPMDGSRAGWRVISHRSRGPEGPPIEATTEMVTLVGESQALRLRLQEIEAKLESRRQRLALLMGDAAAARYVEGERTKWIRFGMRTGQVNWRSVAAELCPDPAALERRGELHRYPDSRVLALPRHPKEPAE